MKSHRAIRLTKSLLTRLRACKEGKKAGLNRLIYTDPERNLPLAIAICDDRSRITIHNVNWLSHKLDINYLDKLRLHLVGNWAVGHDTLYRPIVDPTHMAQLLAMCADKLAR